MLSSSSVMIVSHHLGRVGRRNSVSAGSPARSAASAGSTTIDPLRSCGLDVATVREEGPARARRGWRAPRLGYTRPTGRGRPPPHRGRLHADATLGGTQACRDRQRSGQEGQSRPRRASPAVRGANGQRAWADVLGLTRPRRVKPGPRRREPFDPELNGSLGEGSRLVRTVSTRDRRKSPLGHGTAARLTFAASLPMLAAEASRRSALHCRSSLPSPLAPPLG